MATTSPLRIGIYGPEENCTSGARGCTLWPLGYAAMVQAAGAMPVPLGQTVRARAWPHVLADLQGVIWTGKAHPDGQPSAEEERLCHWSRKNGLPLLAVDAAMHALNAVYGGSLHLDLTRERPEALQHRHPPEPGLRHAIMIPGDTRLGGIYGEGELVVNSEHRRAVARPANGFRVSALALDGVIEAIEAESATWFAIGVQWRPASASASGLDIQLFRGLVIAAQERLGGKRKKARAASTSAA